MPTFTPEQHAHEVNGELREAIEKLSKKARRKLLKAIAKHVKEIETGIKAPSQRVDDK